MCHRPRPKGSDAIPAEICKAGGQPMAEKLTDLFHCMWMKGAIPQEFRDASIIHVYKQKRNAQVCDNYRVISLLSIAVKILANVLLNRLNEHLDLAGHLPENQWGFRKDRGTINKSVIKACLDYMICRADFVMYDFVMHDFSVYTGIRNHV